jgi:hypothetical protein
MPASKHDVCHQLLYVGNERLMVQRRQRARFPGEPGEPLCVARKEIGQDFDRHVAIEVGVARATKLVRKRDSNPYALASASPSS